MSKVFLFVDIDVKTGQREFFLERLKAHAIKVRQEPGCETLEIYIDTQNPDRVGVWEIWSSQNDWDIHMNNQNSATWRPVAAPYVNGETIKVMASA